MGKTVDNSVDNVKNSLQIHRFISRVFPGANGQEMHIPVHMRGNYPQKTVDKMVTGNLDDGNRNHLKYLRKVTK